MWYDTEAVVQEEYVALQAPAEEPSGRCGAATALWDTALLIGALGFRQDRSGRPCAWFAASCADPCHLAAPRAALDPLAMIAAPFRPATQPHSGTRSPCLAAMTGIQCGTHSVRSAAYSDPSVAHLVQAHHFARHHNHSHNGRWACCTAPASAPCGGYAGAGWWVRLVVGAAPLLPSCNLCKNCSLCWPPEPVLLQTPLPRCCCRRIMAAMMMRHWELKRWVGRRRAWASGGRSLVIAGQRRHQQHCQVAVAVRWMLLMRRKWYL